MSSCAGLHLGSVANPFTASSRHMPLKLHSTWSRSCAGRQPPNIWQNTVNPSLQGTRKAAVNRRNLFAEQRRPDALYTGLYTLPRKLVAKISVEPSLPLVTLPLVIVRPH